MNHSRARPPTTPATTPTLICRTNPPATDSTLPAVIPPAANNATIKAMPTGSFAPDSPSRMSPLRPATSRRPSTENTTAGSVGDTAVPSRAARYQSSPNAQCASTAAAAAVRNVPATPITAIGAADRRNRDQPRCMPPSNRMHSNATVTTRSTSCSGGECKSGNSRIATAAAHQEQRRPRNMDPFAQPVGQHGQQPDHRADQHHNGEGPGVTHGNVAGRGRRPIGNARVSPIRCRPGGIRAAADWACIDSFNTAASRPGPRQRLPGC